MLILMPVRFPIAVSKYLSVYAVLYQSETYFKFPLQLTIFQYQKWVFKFRVKVWVFGIRAAWILTLHEKSPNTQVFQVRIFPYSEEIRESTKQEKLYFWTLFTQYDIYKFPLHFIFHYRLLLCFMFVVYNFVKAEIAERSYSTEIFKTFWRCLDHMFAYSIICP